MIDIATETPFSATAEELELAGTAVSRGVAVGRAVWLHGNRRQFFRVDIDRDGLESELQRFRLAFDSSVRDLKQVVVSDGGMTPSAKAIFEVQLLILEHSPFGDEVLDHIRKNQVNAEWALEAVTDQHVKQLRSATDKAFQEKHLDVQDLSERIMAALSGAADRTPDLKPGSVVLASSIRPSTIVSLGRHQPAAIVTEHGGWTSHAFIMAREMGIPAVTGIKDVQRIVKDGSELVVDGFEGSVIVNPSEKTLEACHRHRFSNHHHPAAELPDEPPRTIDGREITIRANADQADALGDLKTAGVQGIGMLRSEYVFGRQFGSLPSEADQFAAYCDIAAVAGENVVRIRTFDLHADQITPQASRNEINPALGLRAIRLSFAYEASFREQLRAILRAAAKYPVHIVLPMVTGVSEIITAKKLVEQERASLHHEGLDAGDPGIGAMIEVPSAVTTIDDIAANVDFVCLGTNDLVQYLLAVDRDNESVSNWYQTLHPAVIRSIRTVLKAADSANIPATICGEMGGSPFYIPLLIGLGAREFSMNLKSVPAVSDVIRGITYEEARELAVEIEQALTAAQAESILKDYYTSKWPHLFDFGGRREKAH